MFLFSILITKLSKYLRSHTFEWRDTFEEKRLLRTKYYNNASWLSILFLKLHHYKISLFKVNDDKFSKSEVSTYQKEESIDLPVQHLILPVGYGDDRFHSNTADLLRKLTERFGTVQSFHGASFADTLYVKL